jgi:hypothetical protein
MLAFSMDPSRHPYLTLALLSVALVVGLVWAYRVVRDVRGESEEETDSPEDLLTPLAEAFAAGQMSEEEYQRIRASLARGAGVDPRFLVGRGPKPRPTSPPEPVPDEAPPSPSPDQP